MPQQVSVAPPHLTFELAHFSSVAVTEAREDQKVLQYIDNCIKKANESSVSKAAKIQVLPLQHILYIHCEEMVYFLCRNSE